MSLSFYRVDSRYCEYLREVDSVVPYTAQDKHTRPFVGVVIEVNGLNYYAPLSSPKPKHVTMKNQVDFLKINGGVLGAINFNNMIPVHSMNLTKVDIQAMPIHTPGDVAYKNLLINQLSWCNSNRGRILNSANKLYNMIIKGKAPNR